ncbi:uncharacterized protein LOC131843136 [Achroia grisella]|uniref:uncharacterized protein LOC131843136 n=1 Tax=Achroia grisella TaxID=688607 RepID=UPI0027D2686A|nr:uncharacterized protein LOC131843136 [Achroia grisella]
MTPPPPTCGPCRGSGLRGATQGAPRTVVRRDLRNPTKLVPATELGTFHARPASKGTPSALAGSGNDAADREPGRGERCAQPGPSKRRAPPSPTSPARGDKRRDVEESPPRDLDLVKVPPTPRIRLVDKGYQPLPSQSGTVRRKPSPPPRSPSPPPDSGSEEEGEDRRFYGDVHASPATAPEPSPAPARVPSPLPRSYTLDRGELTPRHAALESVPQSPEPMLPPLPTPRRRTPPSLREWRPATPTPATTAPAPQMPSQGKIADTGVEPATGRGKYPPIVVERLPNWTRHFDQLRRVLGEAPNARP